MKDARRRLPALGMLAGALLALPASSAWAQLGLPASTDPVTSTTSGTTTTVLGTVGGAIQTTTSTASQLPVAGGTLTDAAGTVGGIVGSVDGTTASSVDQVLGTILSGGGTGAGGSGVAGGGGGAAGPQLSGGTLDDLLQVFAGSLPADAAEDRTAPVAHVRILSRLRQISATGSLRLAISSSEASVVAVGGAVRPGVARRRAYAPGHSRELVKWPAAVLAFRGAGSLQVTIKLSRAARVNLARSRDARIGVATVAADLSRNQRWGYVKRHIAR